MNATVFLNVSASSLCNVLVSLSVFCVFCLVLYKTVDFDILPFVIVSLSMCLQGTIVNELFALIGFPWVNKGCLSIYQIVFAVIIGFLLLDLYVWTFTLMEYWAGEA